MILSRLLVAFVAYTTAVSAHLVLSYPGWRGNTLITNGTLANYQIPPESLAVNWDQDRSSYTFPYGMQWVYPCGGLPTARNRTKWPVTGGAVAFQPGWFAGHSFALIYINLGYGTEPQNMSHPMVPVFQISGPSNTLYNGTVCLPNVPLPVGFKANVGDNATIQVIETAQHGAALYGCVDITFAEPEDVEQVTRENCFNSTDPGDTIGFNLIFATNNLGSSAIHAAVPSVICLIISVMVATVLL